jgi:hypothetical protein
MAGPGRETMACEEGEGMGNDATSFAVIVLSGSNRSIQAAQAQRWSITMQGCGAQRARLIEQQQWAPLDGQGDNLVGVRFAENNARIGGNGTRRTIKLDCNAMQ